MSIRLYVGNLPKDVIDREAFQGVFADSEVAVTTKLIKDRKTGKCRGFGFVTVANDEDADRFIEKYNGHPFLDNPLKIEKALPRSKGKGEQGEEGTPTVSSKPTPKPSVPNPAPTGRKKNKKNSRQKSNGSSQTTVTSTGGNDSFQPDPRWAAQLAMIKEKLNAQAAS